MIGLHIGEAYRTQPMSLLITARNLMQVDVVLQNDQRQRQVLVSSLVVLASHLDVGDGSSLRVVLSVKSSPSLM